MKCEEKHEIQTRVLMKSEKFENEEKATQQRNEVLSTEKSVGGGKMERNQQNVC